MRNHPDVAAIEVVFASKALKRSIKIGEGRGAGDGDTVEINEEWESGRTYLTMKTWLGNGGHLDPLPHRTEFTEKSCIAMLFVRLHAES